MNLLKDITIFVHGEKHSVDACTVSPDTSLNTYLRKHLNLTGTKRMCMEGGCGACIVAVQRKNPLNGGLETFAINSCLVSIFSCYGWNIFTVEGIGNPRSKHPIQAVLARFNGTQCGFCSPGMVMNMYALTESKSMTMKDVDNSFGGNICRCTGYRPILSAFKSICKDASPELIGKYPDIEDLNLKHCIADKKKTCPIDCSSRAKLPFYFKLGKTSWIKVYKFEDILQVIRTFHEQGCRRTKYMFVAGNTAKGVYKTTPVADVYVDILNVTELIRHEVLSDKVVLGANMSLTTTMELFYKLSKENSKFSYLEHLADHIDVIANVPVRNVGSLAGNLMIKHGAKEFPSDIYLIFEAVGAKIEIVDANNKSYFVSPQEFLRVNMEAKVIKLIILPALDSTYKFESYKIMPRAQNAHALVNAAFLLKINDKQIVQSATVVYGCINPNFTHATKTEKLLLNKNIFDNKQLQMVLECLHGELNPDHVLPEPPPKFRRELAVSLFYKYILSIAPKNILSKRNLSGGGKLIRPVSNGTQDFETKESLYPVSKAIPKIEAIAQTTGEAEYIPDMPDLPNQLHGALVLAKAPANSTILKINSEKALKLDGVVAFFDKSDIPGRNTFTPKESNLPMEEELFVSSQVKYYHQPLGVIVAKSQELAEKAADLVEVTYKPGKKPLTTIKEVLKSGIKEKIIQDEFIQRKRKGTDVKHIVKGTFDLDWQYHFHMELQCCNVVPKEDETLDMYPASQWMDLSQTSAAVALGIPANKINVEIRRLGGAFGAKIVRNSLISTAAALAAYKLRQPVKIMMPLEANMNVIGKRYPLSSNYEVAVDDKGVIQYLDNTFYYDHGAGGNERVMSFLFETYLECYNTDTWLSNSNVVNSDMHPSCYIRAPGSNEGVAMSEAIVEHVASTINMDPLEFRLANLNTDVHPKLLEYIHELKEWADVDNRKTEIQKYNLENRWRKRGFSVVPMVFPFNLLFCYGVTVSIYQADGSVALSHGGVEIGQGINTKAAQVCAYKLGVSLEQVSVKPSQSFIAPNSSPTGASVTSEGVCWGVIKACDILISRMKPIKDQMINPTWEQLVKKCFEECVNLSASFMTSPKETELGSYYIYGVAATEIELDVLTGLYQITRVDLLEDVGNSLSPEIDIGQVEGAFVMGQGYYTTEQIVVSDQGEILTNRTWNYKPPGAKDIPIDFRVKFPRSTNNIGVLKSKATGEPPFCLAVSIPLAIRNAVASVREEADKLQAKWYPIDGPSTVEQTFTNCLHNYKQYTL